MPTRSQRSLPGAAAILAAFAPSVAAAAGGITDNAMILTLLTLGLLVAVFLWSIRVRGHLQDRLQELEENLAQRSESEQSLLKMRDEFENRLISGADELNESMRELQEARNALDAANRQLSVVSRIDPLTSIANRRRFDESMDQEIKRMVRGRKPLSLLLCSVDAIEYYRSEHGAERTDAMLVRVAEEVSDCFRRAGDLVARVDQRTFGVIMPGSNAQTAKRFADRLRQKIWDLTIPFQHSPNADRVTASIGISTVLPDRLHKAADILQSATDAVEQARGEGANHVSVAQ